MTSCDSYTNEELMAPVRFGHIDKLAEYCRSQGLHQVYPQCEADPLAACEDHKNIVTYQLNGRTVAKRQTNQMSLEKILLNNPEHKGFFCVTTSTRDEPNAKPGRHKRRFNMFEFELKGGMDVLVDFAKGMLRSVGFTDADFTEVDYMEMCKKYGVETIEHDEEEKMCQDYSPVVFLKYFNEESDPFWNMKRENGLANKLDVIIYGQETVGSAERSCDVQQMRDSFNTIDNGEYCRTMEREFGDDIYTHLDQYLGYDFFQRCGGGVGLSRLERALKIREEMTNQNTEQ